MCKEYFTKGTSPFNSLNDRIIIGGLAVPPMSKIRLQSLRWLYLMNSVGTEKNYLRIETDWEQNDRFKENMYPHYSMNYKLNRTDRISTLWCPICEIELLDIISLDTIVNLCRLGGMLSVIDYLVSLEFVLVQPYLRCSPNV